MHQKWQTDERKPTARTSAADAQTFTLDLEAGSLKAPLGFESVFGTRAPPKCLGQCVYFFPHLMAATRRDL